MLNNLELKVPPVIVFIAALALTWYCATLNVMPLPHPLRPSVLCCLWLAGLLVWQALWRSGSSGPL